MLTFANNGERLEGRADVVKQLNEMIPSIALDRNEITGLSVVEFPKLPVRSRKRNQNKKHENKDNESYWSGLGRFSPRGNVALRRAKPATRATYHDPRPSLGSPAGQHGPYDLLQVQDSAGRQSGSEGNPRLVPAEDRTSVPRLRRQDQG